MSSLVEILSALNDMGQRVSKFTDVKSNNVSPYAAIGGSLMDEIAKTRPGLVCIGGDNITPHIPWTGLVVKEDNEHVTLLVDVTDDGVMIRKTPYSSAAGLWPLEDPDMVDNVISTVTKIIDELTNRRPVSRGA